MFIQDIKNLIDDLNTGLTCDFGNIPQGTTNGIILREMGGSGYVEGVEKPLLVVLVYNSDYLVASQVAHKIYNYFLTLKNEVIPYGTIDEVTNIGLPSLGDTYPDKYSMGIGMTFTINRSLN